MRIMPDGYSYSKMIAIYTVFCDISFRIIDRKSEIQEGKKAISCL